MDCASAKRRGRIADASCLRVMRHPDGTCERCSCTVQRERIGSELALARQRDNKRSGQKKERINGGQTKDLPWRSQVTFIHELARKEPETSLDHDRAMDTEKEKPSRLMGRNTEGNT